MDSNLVIRWRRGDGWSEQLMGFWNVGRSRERSLKRNLLMEKFHESSEAWRADFSTQSKDYKTSSCLFCDLHHFSDENMRWGFLPIVYSYNRHTLCEMQIKLV
jgi:hypothetical protein